MRAFMTDKIFSVIGGCDQVLRLALAICRHCATSYAVNVSRRFNFHDLFDTKVHPVVIQCLVKVLSRTSSGTEQI